MIRLIPIVRLLIVGSLILALIVFAFSNRGGLLGFLSQPCRQAAEQMNLDWTWTLEKGCFIRQSNGVWTPLDVYKNQ